MRGSFFHKGKDRCNGCIRERKKKGKKGRESGMEGGATVLNRCGQRGLIFPNQTPARRNTAILEHLLDYTSQTGDMQDFFLIKLFVLTSR